MKTYVFAICLVVAGACSTTALPDPPTTSSDTAALGNACTISCNNASIQCNATCDRNPRPNCEQSCDQRLLNCMQACGCPFNEDTFTTTFDHLEATSAIICAGTGSSGTAYRVYNIFDRTDDVRRTLQCDGTTTSSLVSSTVAATGLTCDGEVPPPSGCNPVNGSPGGLVACPH